MNKARRVLMVFLTAIMVLMTPITGFARQQPERTIKIWINDFYIMSDVHPFIEYGRTYVPIRFIAEELGYNVSWDGNNRQVIITKGNTTIRLTLDSQTALINNQVTLLEAPAKSRQARTFVPLRLIADLFGEKISYDSNLKIALIGEDFSPDEYYPLKYFFKDRAPFITNFKVNFAIYFIRYSDGRLIQLNSDSAVLSLIDAEVLNYKEPDFISSVDKDKQLFDRYYVAPLEKDSFVGTWYGITKTVGTSDYYDVYVYIERLEGDKYLFTQRAIKENGSELRALSYAYYDSSSNIMKTEESHSTFYATGDFNYTWYSTGGNFKVEGFDYMQYTEDEKIYLRKY